MDESKNPRLELAYEYVCNTDQHIFLTGKAGTGKTTFLHRIKGEVVKRMVVVAPTGVAAINAGGMTIHSFFQLPFGPRVPGMVHADARQRRFSKKKIGLIKSLDLLVIDEISMVRADLLDAIDEVLRRYRDAARPFGGVQLLMIGDLNQLPPVVKPDEWELLRPHYQTPYFFGSIALRQTSLVTIELKHIYRQSDERFIGLLNKVRDNQLDSEVLDLLNSRYRAGFCPPEEDGYITLTSHNASARAINDEHLRALPGEPVQFRAKIKGTFPEHAFPTGEVLELKKGAQVMFVKNDPQPEKLFFNGKIGRIVRFEEDAIIVQCPDDADEIAVTTLEWNNLKYTLNEQTKEVEEEIIGTFIQYPLKTAWAITIHKSQGLTFERAIIDARSAFAHGQVYVALSRCKSFEGIVLRSKIYPASVKTDEVVTDYNEKVERNAPGENDLHQSKKAYQQKLIAELFDYRPVQQAIGRLNRVLLERPGAFHGEVTGSVNALLKKAEETVFSVSKQFATQLNSYFLQPTLPEENTDLQNRIKKAAAWFLDQLDTQLLPALSDIHLLSDNQQALKRARERKEEVKKELMIKKACLISCSKGFSTAAYVRAKTDAGLQTQLPHPERTPAQELPEDSPHPKLFLLLRQWRKKTASKKGLSPYEVLSMRSMIDITRCLPVSTKTLRQCRGIGDAKIKQYGAAILAVVDQYVKAKGIPADQFDLSIE